MKSGLAYTKRSILIKELNQKGIFYNEEGTSLRDLPYADLKLLIYKARETESRN